MANWLDVGKKIDQKYGIGEEIRSERRLGTFRREVDSFNGPAIKYIKTNCPENMRLMQIRLVIHEPNQTDLF